MGVGPWRWYCWGYCATSDREGVAGFSGASVVEDDGVSDLAAGFAGGRVAVVGKASKSSYMGFLD